MYCPVYLMYAELTRGWKVSQLYFAISVYSESVCIEISKVARTLLAPNLSYTFKQSKIAREDHRLYIVYGEDEWSVPCVLNLNKLTSKCLKGFVGVVSQEALIIFVLLTGANELGLVCRSQRHRQLTPES